MGRPGDRRIVDIAAQVDRELAEEVICDPVTGAVIVEPFDATPEMWAAHRQLASIARRLRCKPEEVPARVERLAAKVEKREAAVAPERVERSRTCT